MTKNSLPSLKAFNLCIIGLIFVGLLFIGLSSSTEGLNLSHDQYLFFRKQIIWIVLGFGGFLIGRFINLKLVQKMIPLLYISSVILLLLVLLPQIGFAALGASRRIDLGFVGVQPSEIVKLTAILFFANIFSQLKTDTLKSLLLYLVPPLILIMFEPNLSTTVLLATIVVSLFYLAGGNIFTVFSIGIIAISLSLLLIITSPYRKARLTTSYHSNQLILSIGSGGFFGKGLGNSEQKYRFLPKISTDSILAIIGEETGFLGIFLLTLGYFFIISYLFKLSVSLTSSFESLIVAGIGLWITFQTLINYTAVSGLIPLTGQPLPLISYGGSSLITLLFGFGLVENIQTRALLLYSIDNETANMHSHHRDSPHSRHRADSPTSRGSKH
ncbi:MAG: FtsW/RodA/SpoVE family cell cycle protein [Candidatus Shapirobacteria bacterium]|nr:FtsW/RodA/SpoVE family cell cycle protein [Candidatus Shapirobacteria bacterium]